MMELVIAVAIGILGGSGVWLVLRPRTFQVIMGLALLAYAVNLFIFSMGSLSVGEEPIIKPGVPPDLLNYTDPMPQALVLTAIVISFATTALLLVVVLASRFLFSGQGEPSRVLEFAPNVSPAVAVLGAALIAFYSFVGFEVSANVAEEVKNVQRNYPRALFGALVVAGLVYMGVGLAATAVLPPAALTESSAPLLDVVRATGYAVPDWLFAAVALVAVANGALLTMIMSSRLAYGMADEGLMPSVLTRVLPERRTPWLAIILTTLLAMILTVTGTLTVARAMRRRTPLSCIAATIVRVASIPSSSGMRMSIRITFGRKRAAFSTASTPFSASATTSTSPSRESSMRKPARTMDWSSTTRTRMLIGSRARVGAACSGRSRRRSQYGCSSRRRRS